MRLGTFLAVTVIHTTTIACNTTLLHEDTTMCMALLDIITQHTAT